MNIAQVQGTGSSGAKVFYSEGLRFECTRCNRCCRHEPGYVFLTRTDLKTLVKATGLSEGEFNRRYTKTVRMGEITRLSLKEKRNYDCIFWENDGCTVYESRPLQCRAFPFWAHNVDTQESWERASRDCPGIGRGPIHSREVIDSWLARRLVEQYAEGIE